MSKRCLFSLFNAINIYTFICVVCVCMCAAATTTTAVSTPPVHSQTERETERVRERNPSATCQVAKLVQLVQLERILLTALAIYSFICAYARLVNNS